MKKSTRIIFLGNELVGDDGAGPRIGRALAGLEMPENVSVETRHNLAIDLLDDLLPNTELLFVDATKTGKPAGTCRVFEFEDVESLANLPYCCHAMGLSELLELARGIDPRIAPRVRLVGVEAEVLDRFTTRLSEGVAAALPSATRLVLELVDASAELIEQAILRAEELARWVPEPHEL